MTNITTLKKQIISMFPDLAEQSIEAVGELTITVSPQYSHDVLKQLRDDSNCQFDLLVDVCGVDYLAYGRSDWETEQATANGFSRAVTAESLSLDEAATAGCRSRFAVVYHLLSTVHNHRLRVKVFLEETHLMVPSVHDIWGSANWFEREAYDLFGILFENHPDLRRILTDYGFIGHPFRKDFPLSGHVEVRYDATIGRVIYEAVDIVPRVTVPRVIRHDNRYVEAESVNK